MVDDRRKMARDYSDIITQFGRFAVVGVAGLVIDAAIVYTMRDLLGLYVAGLLSYIGAATGTWLLNRIWTFRGYGEGRAFHQWLRFLAANSLGFVLNRGTYFLLIATVPLAVSRPIIAIAAGSAAGMLVNFSLSRKLVFKS